MSKQNEATKEGDIMPCPFCGSPAKHCVGLTEHWVRCSGCKASGPMMDTKQHAVNAWNTRSATVMVRWSTVHFDFKGLPIDTPFNRASVAAIDLCDMIDTLQDDDAVKVIEVLKQRMMVSIDLKGGDR